MAKVRKGLVGLGLLVGLVVAVLLINSSVKGQTTLFSEDFSDTPEGLVANGWTPQSSVPGTWRTFDLATSDQGLVSSYSADGNANYIVSQNPKIFLGGVTTDLPGKVGNGFSFNGVDAAVALGDALDQYTTGSGKQFTTSFWTKINSLSAAAFIGKWQTNQFSYLRYHTLP